MWCFKLTLFQRSHQIVVPGNLQTELFWNSFWYPHFMKGGPEIGCYIHLWWVLLQHPWTSLLFFNSFLDYYMTVTTVHIANFIWSFCFSSSRPKNYVFFPVLQCPYLGFFCWLKKEKYFTWSCLHKLWVWRRFLTTLFELFSLDCHSLLTEGWCS
jgi:hypothetical protein